jgi:dihydroorotate dehydrogenase (fumarate)
VASASPLTGDPEAARRIADAGAGAIVLPSLFEEEILHEEVGLTDALEAGSEHFAEALDYFPAVQRFENAADRYLALLRATKTMVDVPVIASLNATSTGSWVRYARLLEEAGADAIELNLYRVAASADRTAADMEDADATIVTDVGRALDIPLAVKLSPYYSALASFARRVVGAGAAGLVLFNRFYQPDVDLESRDVVARLELSHQWELRLPLRWIAILRPQLGTDVALAATSGIHSGTDVAKALLVGADVAMMTSALLVNGPNHVLVVERQLTDWMTSNEYESVAQLRGSLSHSAAGDPSAFERANYLKTLHSWSAPFGLTQTSPSGGTSQ